MLVVLLEDTRSCMYAELQTLLNLGQALSSAYLQKYVIYVLHGAKDVTALMCAIAPLRVSSGVSVLFFFPAFVCLFDIFNLVL